MEKILIIAILIFVSIAFLYQRFLNGYAKEKFGEKWPKIWGNKVYFWQSVIFISTAGTIIVMYLLKVSRILSWEQY